MMASSIDHADESTRLQLQRIATHVLARAQHPTTGRLGLRVAPGGFGTVEYGAERLRLRISGSALIRESSGSTSAQGLPLAGASLRQLAEFAQVDLSTEFSAGNDSPPLGDVDAPIALDADAVHRIAAWFELTARALDDVLGSVPTWSSPSVPQLWPEHFDVAIDLAFDPSAPAERRVNLGGSCGDAHRLRPYLYVGPWTPERPGERAFWNAPFGAVLGAERLPPDEDHLLHAAGFFRAGLDRLVSPGSAG